MLDGIIIREIRADELAQLLELYVHLHPKDLKLDIKPEIERLWAEIISNPNLHYFVADSDGRLVSTCTLTTIPNLTRGARPYGLVENVVTHPDFRRRKIGTYVLQAALNHAWRENCYKVMLLTGRKDEGIVEFYEQAGFVFGMKKGFVATPPEN